MVKKKMLPLLALGAGAVLWPQGGFAASELPEISHANTAWILICSALVMLMTPALAFFYAGMVRRKNVVSTLFKNYAALSVVGLLWAVVGYSLAFSEGNSWVGSWETNFMMDRISQGSFILNGSVMDIPEMSFVLFQMMFAIITPALIIGSLVERVNFKAWLIIMGLWSLLVYAPICHWVWGEGGWIGASGGLDFAGGLVVHISSGVSALVAAFIFGRRVNDGEASKPTDVSMVLLGAALLWFGWFGFNAGSALAANGIAAQAFGTTFMAAAAAFLSWMMFDWIANGKPTAVGSAIGLVAGLVAITPSAGFVSIKHAIIIGLTAGVVCNYASRLIKRATRLDDALDVFGCHGVGGFLGTVMTGLFASSAVNSSVSSQGFFIDGSIDLLAANFVGAASVIVYCVIMTFVLIRFVGLFFKLRVSEAEEMAGLDDSQHGEMFRYREQVATPPVEQK